MFFLFTFFQTFKIEFFKVFNINFNTSFNIRLFIEIHNHNTCINAIKIFYLTKNITNFKKFWISKVCSCTAIVCCNSIFYMSISITSINKLKSFSSFI